ncbi:hypothetical protein [Actinokineospora sp. NPDC004072]
MSRAVSVARWVLLGAAVVLLLVFIAAQRSGDFDVSYGRSPSSGKGVGSPSGPAVELPSKDELAAMLRRDPVVRLPGSVAQWDAARVGEVLGDLRILVTPPGLTEEQDELIREVEEADIRVVGTSVSGGIYQAVSNDQAGWRDQFTTGDVTGQIALLAAKLRELPDPADDPNEVDWREPTAAEVDAVAADLRAKGFHAAPGSTLTALPANSDGALVAAFPQQGLDKPVPRYGAALTGLFPDRPVLVAYGNWVEYHGPHADEVTEVASGSFYAQSGDLLSKRDYPQDNVLRAYLDRLADVRYSGLFDRPLPYQPFDPLRVALPALPWLFAACVLAFLVLTVRARPRPATTPTGLVARIAGLTTLAIEMSALSRHPALVRAITHLQAARGALDDNLPERHVRKLLADAERELETAARKLGRADYRPGVYLAGGIS